MQLSGRSHDFTGVLSQIVLELQAIGATFETFEYAQARGQLVGSAHQALNSLLRNPGVKTIISSESAATGAGSQRLERLNNRTAIVFEIMKKGFL